MKKDAKMLKYVVIAGLLLLTLQGTILHYTSGLKETLLWLF